jgi:Flp pilus assembly protein TadD
MHRDKKHREERERRMSKSPRKAGILLFLVIVVAALALVASGCSAKTAIIGSTTAASSSTSITASAAGGAASTVAGSTGTTRIVDGGKTAEEYAAEMPDLQKAVDANPTDLAALQALAVAQYNSTKYDDAVATYLKMLQISDEPMTRNNYANVLRDSGKKNEAKAEYEKAIAAEPSLTVAYMNLVGMYNDEKNIAEANKVLDRGIAATTGEDQTRLKNYKVQLNTPTTT